MANVKTLKLSFFQLGNQKWQTETNFGLDSEISDFFVGAKVRNLVTNSQQGIALK